VKAERERAKRPLTPASGGLNELKRKMIRHFNIASFKRLLAAATLYEGAEVRCMLVAGTVTLAAVSPSRAADLAPQEPDPIRAAFFDDATFTLHMRSYLLDENNNGADDPAAWAAGGWAGYETGWINDTLQFGVVAYTSQPLWAPEERPGSLLLLPDQEGFSVLGQAYAALRYDDQTLTIGRQLVHQPEINPHDNRMVPITFEGASLGGDVGMLSYYAAFLTATKTRGSNDFKNFGEVVGVDQDEPMYLVGLSAEPNDKLKLRTSLYAVPNLLVSSYSDAQWMTGKDDEDHVKLTAQFMIQSGIGEELLTGPDFVSSMAGVLGEVRYSDLTLMAGYTANLTDKDWQYPYGEWPGYTDMLIGIFARAAEQAVFLGANYDFSGPLEGLSLMAQAALDTHIADGRTWWNEYDFYANYEFSALPNVPHWLAPLSLRARYALLQKSDDDAQTDISDEVPVTPDTDEIRVIMNYEVQFHGKDL
jgi:hypothetical protein